MNFIRIKNQIMNLEHVESVILTEKAIHFNFPHFHTVTVEIKDIVDDEGIMKKLAPLGIVSIPKPPEPEKEEEKEEKKDAPA